MSTHHPLPLVARLAKTRQVTTPQGVVEINKAVILRQASGSYLLCPLNDHGHCYLRSVELNRQGEVQQGGVVHGVVSARSDSPSWFARLVRFNDQRLPIRAIALVSFIDSEYRMSLIYQETFEPLIRQLTPDEDVGRIQFVAKAGLSGTTVVCRRWKE